MLSSSPPVKAGRCSGFKFNQGGAPALFLGTLVVLWRLDAAAGFAALKYSGPYAAARGRDLQELPVYGDPHVRLPVVELTCSRLLPICERKHLKIKKKTTRCPVRREKKQGSKTSGLLTWGRATL